MSGISMRVMIIEYFNFIDFQNSLKKKKSNDAKKYLLLINYTLSQK